MSHRTRVARLEKVRGIGACRNMVVQIPLGMSIEAARAILGPEPTKTARNDAVRY